MNDFSPTPQIADVSRTLASRAIVDADYRLMVETVTDYAIFMIDAAGVVRSWNAGAERLKGYKPDEIIGRHFSAFYPQELIEKNWPQHELVVAAETGRFEDEGWRVRKDGTRFWANIIITRLLGPDGNIRGYAKITRDLTERRRDEESLRLSEERFRLLVESVKEYAIFMLDPAGHIVSWNRGAEKNKGYNAAEIIGKHFSVFYPEELRNTEMPAQELAAALSEGQYEEEGWRVRKDGSRFWANVVITAVYDDHGRHLGFAKVTRDMTENRKMTELVDEGKRITSYLATLGHELRNPLAPITNALALMHRVEIESGVVRSARDIIDRQIRQMSRLVDDLLDVSRVASGKIRLEMKPVAIAQVVEQAVEAAQPLISAKRHELRVSQRGQHVWVSGDQARLVQILTNLLNNAAKFTPESGLVEVEIEVGKQTVEIRVRDNGPGISEQLQNRIFNLFAQGEQTLSRDLGGLGIGLALARQLAQLQGGNVRAYSKGTPGSGSEFVFSMPVVSAPIELQRAGGRKRVLIVDDNRDSADTMSMLVESLGYDCMTVYDGHAALAMTLSHSPDLLLMDIGLPGMDGYEVARRIRAEVVNPPKLIAISGYGQESDREASFAAGFQTHLSKPVDFDQIMLVLKRSLS